MFCKHKALGVVLVASLALTASMVSVAQAANFQASKYPTTVTGQSAKGNEVLKFEAGDLTCKGHFTGTLAEASGAIVLTPAYSECQAFGFLNATVDMEGCTYKLYAGGSLDLVCPAGMKVTVISGTCALTISPQTGLQGVLITNRPGGDFAVRATLSGIGYTITTDGLFCSFSGIGVRSGGTYTQTVDVTVQSTNGAIVSVK